jgi:hypothetical protein
MISSTPKTFRSGERGEAYSPGRGLASPLLPLNRNTARKSRYFLTVIKI